MTRDEVERDLSVETIARYLAEGGDIDERSGFRDWSSKIAGYSVRVLDDQHQLSVAESAADHDRVWYRFFLSAGQLYGQRRAGGFGDSLVAQVREGFERLRAQRGR